MSSFAGSTDQGDAEGMSEFQGVESPIGGAVDHPQGSLILARRHSSPRPTVGLLLESEPPSRFSREEGYKFRSIKRVKGGQDATSGNTESELDGKLPGNLSDDEEKLSKKPLGEWLTNEEKLDKKALGELSGDEEEFVKKKGRDDRREIWKTEAEEDASWNRYFTFSVPAQKTEHSRSVTADQSTTSVDAGLLPSPLGNPSSGKEISTIKAKTDQRETTRKAKATEKGLSHLPGTDRTVSDKGKPPKKRGVPRGKPRKPIKKIPGTPEANDTLAQELLSHEKTGNRSLPRQPLEGENSSGPLGKVNSLLPAKDLPIPNAPAIESLKRPHSAVAHDTSDDISEDWQSKSRRILERLSQKEVDATFEGDQTNKVEMNTAEEPVALDPALTQFTSVHRMTEGSLTSDRRLGLELFTKRPAPHIAVTAASSSISHLDPACADRVTALTLHLEDGIRSQTEQGVEMYVCNYGQCNRRFVTEELLESHQESHDGSRAWKCRERLKPFNNTCSLTFRQRNFFELHLRESHGIKEEAIEKRLQRGRLGFQGSRFWCGFCRRTINIKHWSDSERERLDHVDKHLLGRVSKNDALRWKEPDDDYMSYGPYGSGDEDFQDLSMPNALLSSSHRQRPVVDNATQTDSLAELNDTHHTAPQRHFVMPALRQGTDGESNRRFRQVGVARVWLEIVSLLPRRAGGPPSVDYESESSVSGYLEDENSTVADEEEDNGGQRSAQESLTFNSGESVNPTQPGKRKRSASTGRDDGEDDDIHRRRNGQPSKAHRPAVSLHRPRFACPYRAYDHLQPCFRKGPKNPQGGCEAMHRLKQHFRRRHFLSTRCQRCWTSFDSKKLLIEHGKKPCPAKERPSNEFLMSDEHENIVGDVCGKGSDEATWWYYFQLLIPGKQNVDIDILKLTYSPYYVEFTYTVPSITISDSQLSHAGTTPLSMPGPWPQREEADNASFLSLFDPSSGSDVVSNILQVETPVFSTYWPPVQSLDQHSMNVIQATVAGVQNQPTTFTYNTPGASSAGFPIPPPDMTPLLSSDSATTPQTHEPLPSRLTHERIRNRNMQMEAEIRGFRRERGENEDDIRRLDMILDEMFDMIGVPKEITNKLNQLAEIVNTISKRLR